jgi:hypothetical protein
MIQQQNQQQQLTNFCMFCNTTEESQLIAEDLKNGYRIYKCAKCCGITFNDVCKLCSVELASSRILRVKNCVACDYSLTGVIAE